MPGARVSKVAALNPQIRQGLESDTGLNFAQWRDSRLNGI
jgi:hypothetical protein